MKSNIAVEEMKSKEEYRDYTLGLALFDAVPVLLFLLTGVTVFLISGSRIFLAGVIASFIGGSSKVIWKLIVVIKGEDRSSLTRVFHIMLPAGFGLMLLAVIVGIVSDLTKGPVPGGRGTISGICEAFSMMPAALFFIAGIAGMCLMGYLGSHMDDSAGSAWIEEIINTAAQLAFLAGVIIVYFGLGYTADAAAADALRGTDKVAVTETEESYFFDGPGMDTVIVFYPGAKVEPGAYAQLMDRLAEDGADCFLCRMPADFALFDRNMADDIKSRYDSGTLSCGENDYRHWYLAGHSLGGAAASMMLAGSNEDEQGKWDGIIFLASYPAGKTEVPALSIYGSEDGVLDHNSYEESQDKGYWPEDTEEFIIEGGNHALFGSYGFQKGDRPAEISSESQQRQTAETVTDWIRRKSQ